ncbi:PLP-dependent aminotransferase family protein [Brevibacterium sp. W7.2]|uniref:MocR-like pyridoxine biosynthesis transcription factor PdxR n=1 Tax=Brevibacterium sp. W7.2 TaxID=2823518 RepID=UPI001BA67552|nr:PLP-dependent aminotransferase family protein [Brevibacterium sp. W7.2]
MSAASSLPRSTRESLDIVIDHGSPLPDQIVAGIRDLVTRGELRPGDPVPSSRRLAGHLGVSRGTIETAYAQLAVEGYLLTRERAATIVDPDLPTALLRHTDVPAPPSAPQRPPRRLIDLRPGHGGDDPLRDPAFRRAWREALDVDPGAVDPLGQPGTRWAIADHLRLLRGMSVDPRDIIVTSGSRDGLRLLFASGLDGAIGVENPGFPGLRLAMADRELLAFDVSTGLEIERLKELEGQVAAVVVTPNHQFPHGGTMPVSTRIALLTWAAGAGVVVIEDDYDSEARLQRTSVPTLFDLAGSLDLDVDVVHIGTFSTVLTTAVSTGYIVARGRLGEAMSAVRTSWGPAIAPVLQSAIAAYLESGGLRRRIARGRRRLRAAEAVVAEAGAIPGLVHEGRTLVIETDEDGAQVLLRELEGRGIRVASLAAGWSGDSAVRHGIVIAHSNVEATVLRSVLGLIQTLSGEHREPTASRIEP